MLIISILILGFFRSFSQTNERQYIFNQLEKIYSQEVDEKFERFTPTRDEIKIADSLIQFHVTEKTHEYSWAEKISNYSSYYRQYVGYINEKVKKYYSLTVFANGKVIGEVKSLATWAEVLAFLRLKLMLIRN